jgi:hypothetical protein
VAVGELPVLWLDAPDGSGLPTLVRLSISDFAAFPMLSCDWKETQHAELLLRRPKTKIVNRPITRLVGIFKLKASSGSAS